MRTGTLAVAGATVALAAPGPAAAQDPVDVLPNLVQAAPGNIGVESGRTDGRRWFHLGFDSATENRGAGWLRVRGSRTSNAFPTMQVDQLVTRSDGSVRTVPRVGLMRYVVHRDHQHWHYMRFARYELRPAGSGARGRRDRKTGFCLGDRYRLNDAATLPGYQPRPAQTGRCGLRRPNLLEMFEGISTGYGDNYFAQLEGQYVDVTGLRGGRYRLLHTANPTGTLLETDYRDNVATAELRISWPRGKQRRPRVRVLRRCDGRGRCV